MAEARSCTRTLESCTRNSASVRQLIPPEQRNILFEALTFFCDESELKNLVVRPLMRRAQE